MHAIQSRGGYPVDNVKSRGRIGNLGEGRGESKSRASQTAKRRYRFREIPSARGWSRGEARRPELNRSTLRRVQNDAGLGLLRDGRIRLRYERMGMHQMDRVSHD